MGRREDALQIALGDLSEVSLGTQSSDQRTLHAQVVVQRDAAQRTSAISKKSCILLRALDGIGIVAGTHGTNLIAANFRVTVFTPFDAACLSCLLPAGFRNNLLKARPGDCNFKFVADNSEQLDFCIDGLGLPFE